MKFNIEVEIDYIHEGDIDDVVKEKIISGITKQINDEVMEEIRREASNRIEKNIDKVIGKKITETYDEMMGEEIKVTDRWGDIKEKGTIRDIIKKRFENAMKTKVNDRGEPSSYKSVGTRRQYLINKRVEKVIDKKVKELTEYIDDNINKKLEENLKTEIGEKLFKTLDLDKFIKNE